MGFTLNRKKEPIDENDLDDVISEKAIYQKITKQQLEKNDWVFKYTEVLEGIPLRDVLQEVKEKSVEIDKSQKYHEIEVKNLGRGITKRIRYGKDFIYGSRIKSPRWIVKRDYFVFSKIQIRRGTMGVITPDLGGCLVASTFLLFQLRKEYNWLNPHFLASYLTTDFYQNHFERLSVGTTRNMVSCKDFLDTGITLTQEELKQKSLEFTEKQKKKLELELDLLNERIKKVKEIKKID